MPRYILFVRVFDRLLLSATANITVIVVDINEAPEFTSASIGAKEVPENSAVGTLVGQVAARDVDAGQSLAYSLPAGQVFPYLFVAPIHRCAPLRSNNRAD